MFVLITSLAGGIFKLTRHPLLSKRPRYIFINETKKHEHNLAFKMSLKLAETRSGVENALILLEQLPPQKTIEQTASELFQKWRIGATRGGKGILYLYSEKENLFKIEVSYVLEPVFTDLFLHHIEQSAQTYMLSEIPQDFISELLITMNIRGEEAAKAKDFYFESPDWLKSAFISGGAGVRELGYQRSLRDYLMAVQRLSKNALSQYGPSSDPKTTVTRYLQSLENGIGDPSLPFLTEGSKVFRIIVPRSRAQQERVREYYQKGMPFQLFVKEGIAIAAFQPGVANLPVFLRLGTDGLWYIDEPKAWTYYHRFEGSNGLFRKYSNSPFSAELVRMKHGQTENAIYLNHASAPVLPSYPYSLEKKWNNLKIKLNQEPENPSRYSELGEFYLFEIDWLNLSIEMFEKARGLVPDNLQYRWRLFDLYLNASQMEKALTELEYIAQRLPNDRYVQNWWESYRKEYQFEAGDFF